MMGNAEMGSAISDNLHPGEQGCEKTLSSPEHLLGNEEHLLEKVALARQALQTDLAFLFVFDQSRDELIAYLSLDQQDEPRWQKMHWKAGEELTGLFVSRTPGWEKQAADRLVPMLNKGAYASLLLCPLPLTVDKYGIFGVAANRPNHFQQGNRSLLDIIGENIRLYGENCKLENSSRWLVRAIDANIRFNKYLTSQPGNLEVVLKQVFDELKTILDVEGCGVLCYDPERKELVLQKPSFGLCDERFKSYALSTEGDRERRLEDEGIGVAVRVFLTGEPYICHTAESDHITNKRIARIYGARSSLSVPLVVESQRIGVLHVINKRKGTFTDDDTRLLELLAGQLAIVIENTHLLRQMEQKNDLLRHSMEIHNSLTRMVLREREMDEIILQLSRLIGREVIVQDHFFKVLGTSLQGEEEDLARIEKTMAGELRRHSGFSELFMQLMTSRQAVSLPASPRYGLQQARLIAPITLSNSILGYVSILETPQRKLDELDCLAIEHAVTVFTLKMMQQKIAYDVAERIKGDFLNDLLNGNYQSSEDMLQRASYLGYDFSRPHQVLYMETRSDNSAPPHPDEGGPLPVPLERSTFEFVDNFLKNRLPGAMVVNIKDEAIVIIAPYPQQKSLPKPEEVAISLKDALKDLVPDKTMLIGVGRICNDILEINNSYREGCRAISIARKLNKTDEVINYDSLGIYKLLFAVKDKKVLRDYAEQLLRPVLNYDREKNDILLPTLRNYMLCNCNNQRTADSLFIHLNTLKYRLQKIQDICNVDLSDPEERLNLQLAIKVLEVKNI